MSLFLNREKQSVSKLCITVWCDGSAERRALLGIFALCCHMSSHVASIYHYNALILPTAFGMLIHNWNLHRVITRSCAATAWMFSQPQQRFRLLWHEYIKMEKNKPYCFARLYSIHMSVHLFVLPTRQKTTKIEHKNASVNEQALPRT